MPYGTVKVDNVTFTNNSVDATTTFSGIYASITNNLTLSGTATAATFTGTTANFTNVNAQNISVTTSLSGLAITGGTAGFTTITGTTVTGTTANFATLSGTTVTGTTARFITITGGTAGFTTITGTTVTGTTANFVTVSGTTVTGTTASFTSGIFTSLSGTTHTITSGVFALGTAALPSISFVSDPNTGIYSPGADQVAVATNGTEKLIVLSNGNVGIGTSSVNAGAKLHVAKNATGEISVIRISGNDGVGDGGAGITFADNETVKWSLFTRRYSSANKFYISTAENDTASAKVTITEGGAVGIGTTSPGVLLDLSSATAASRLTSTTGTNPSYINFNNTAGNAYIGIESSTGGGAAVGNAPYALHLSHQGAYPINFSTNNALRATIDSSGRLLVGTTNDAGSPSNRIVVGANGICGVKKTFTNLDTTPQGFGFQAVNASVYVAHLQSVSTSSVAFLIACVYDTAVGIVMATTALGRCTASGQTISGINNDARTYTFQRDAGTGEFTVTASAVATGSTIIALTPLNQFL